MTPEREHGDDRVMIKIRPLRNGKPYAGWGVMNDQEGAVEDMIDGDDPNNYEVVREVVTAEEWNAMPEFEGW